LRSLRKLPLSFPLNPVCHLSQLSWQQLVQLKEMAWVSSTATTCWRAPPPPPLPPRRGRCRSPAWRRPEHLQRKPQMLLGAEIEQSGSEEVLFPFGEGEPALKPLDRDLTYFHGRFPPTLSLVVFVVVLLPSRSLQPPFYLVGGKASIISSFPLPMLMLPFPHKISPLY